MLQGGEIGKERARALRRTMSLPEVLLWQQLKTRPGDFKFRKQHPSGPYVADFYCHEARLVIEVDGEAHERGDRPMRDAQRDAWFADRNLDVLRIGAKDVLKNIEGVVQAVVVRAEARAAQEIR